MKNIHKSVFFMSVIDNIIPVSIALVKTISRTGGGWAGINVARHRFLAAPSFLPKSGGAIAPPPTFIDAPVESSFQKSCTINANIS